MTARLSKNFTMKELTVTRHGDNQPSFGEYDQVFSNLQRLAIHVLQRVRDHYGKPVIVTSGFRNERVNELAKGVPNSQHRLGEAADFDVPGVDNLEVAQWIARNLTFDQLILEDYAGGNSGWIHVSYRMGNNRKQVLTKPPGTKKFSPGLPSSTAASVAQTVTQPANVGRFAAITGLGAALWYMIWKRK